MAALEPVRRTATCLGQRVRGTGFDVTGRSLPTRKTPIRTQARQVCSEGAYPVAKLRADVGINSNTTRLPKSYFGRSPNPSGARLYSRRGRGERRRADPDGKVP